MNELVALVRDAGSSGFAVFKDGRYVSGFGENKQEFIYSDRVGLFWFMQLDRQKFLLSIITFHDGDGGQQLMFFPNHRIVVARLRGGQDDKPFNLPRLAMDYLIRPQQP